MKFAGMKRVSEVVEGGSENLGLKKVKLVEGIDQNRSTAVREVAEENGGNGSNTVNKIEGLSGNTVPENLDGHSFGGDINSDINFGNRKEENDLVFDLNVPASETLDDGLDNGCLVYSQKPMINEKEPEVISITSDDSDDEVEITRYVSGYSEKGKQAVSGMIYNTMENLNLGLGIGNMDNAVGGSSFASGGERKHTKEEKGKANVDYQWLSLMADSSIDLDFLTDIDVSLRPKEHSEDFGSGTGHLAVLAAASEIAERALRKEEQELQYRARCSEVSRDIAKRLARADYSDNERGPSTSKQVPQSLSPIEHLGKSPGPFSEALKMVRQRTSKRAAQKLIEWKPRVENRDKTITQPLVPSLLDLSLKALAENAEGIVSLELVPENLCRRFIHLLCDMRKMNADLLNLLIKGCPTEICIKDCSWLTEEQFQQTIGNCQTKDLRVLQLDLCGQCLLDLAFRDALTNSSKSFSSLSIVSLRGACRLSDTGLQNLVMSAPLLRSLNLGQCALLTCDAINCIADYLGANLRELYIDDCNKINPTLILPAFKKFKHLEAISVAGINAISDQFVSEMVTLCSQSIKAIDLANCSKLTDNSLKTIGSSCVHLCSLNISNLHNLTDLGIEHLANGCKSIQRLKLCRNGFSDDTMAAFLESSGESLMELILNNMTKVGPNTAFSIATRSKKLISLDISWCRKISNEALGLIVDNCRSLKLVKVFGCRQITDVFLRGHSNGVVRIVGLNMTPILDHVNLLQHEEMLRGYSGLQS